MPTLHWVGKDKVVNHHHDVPFRVLNKVSTFAAPEGLPANTTDNRIIHGDNLEALKSLLPEFEARVKCIYIDPPYNTGNEGWVYNDAVNDPKMKRWLGQVVGKEGEDLSRHDKWLCMMYPRLKLLRQLLSGDGAIFISMDDNECAYLKIAADEIFGAHNFVSNVVWQKKYTVSNDAKWLSDNHDHILIYARDKAQWRPNRLPRSDQMNERYRNPDGHAKGPWKATPLYAKRSGSETERAFSYTFKNGVVWSAPRGTSPRFPAHELARMDQADEIWFGATGDATPARKTFLNELKQASPPAPTVWLHSEVGSNHEARDDIKAIFGDGSTDFETPKPLRLLHRILMLATDANSIVLDSFAGSGTTGHAVLQLNAKDGGRRRFLAIEMEDYAETITAERLRRASSGYGEGSKSIAGLGGGFDYYTLGEPMFLPDDNLNEAVGTEAIRSYVAYSEGIPAADRATTENPHSPHLLGLNRETAWLFHYEPDRATSLDMDFLSSLRFGGKTGAGKPATVIVYADRCLLSAAFMAQRGIIFKKIPRDITRF